MLNKNFKKAEAVLNIFDDLYGSEEKEYSVATYKSGRENGFAIYAFDGCYHGLAFSEHRSSDDIVVYEMNGTEPIWDSAKHFKLDEYSKAAKYIHNLLN